MSSALKKALGVTVVVFGVGMVANNMYVEHLLSKVPTTDSVPYEIVESLERKWQIPAGNIYEITLADGLEARLRANNPYHNRYTAKKVALANEVKKTTVLVMLDMRWMREFYQNDIPNRFDRVATAYGDYFSAIKAHTESAGAELWVVRIDPGTPLDLPAKMREICGNTGELCWDRLFYAAQNVDGSPTKTWQAVDQWRQRLLYGAWQRCCDSGASPQATIVDKEGWVRFAGHTIIGPSPNDLKEIMARIGTNEKDWRAMVNAKIENPTIGDRVPLMVAWDPQGDVGIAMDIESAGGHVMDALNASVSMTGPVTSQIKEVVDVERTKHAEKLKEQFGVDLDKFEERHGAIDKKGD